MDVPLDFAPFQFKCKCCKEIWDADEVLLYDDGTMMCPRCNDRTEWAPKFDINRPNIQ